MMALSLVRMASRSAVVGGLENAAVNGDSEAAAVSCGSTSLNKFAKGFVINHRDTEAQRKRS